MMGYQTLLNRFRDGIEQLHIVECDGENGPGTYSWEVGIAP